MGEKFKKAEEALDRIKKLSHKSLKREICGFIGYDYALNQYIVQKEENIAATPSSLFLINPLNYLLFKDTYEVVAIFHSHIVGDETASEFDIKMADNSVEIGELKRILSELDDNYKSLFNLLFELQSQKITEQSQGAETIPPQLTEGVNKQTLPPSEVSAPPPEKISTPVEREREVVKPNKEYAPVPNKVTASCPRPRQNLGKYIANINLRKDYSFVVKYDVENKSIVNVTYTRTLPASLKRAIEKYLSSFSLTQDKQGCRLPIKLLKG